LDLAQSVIGAPYQLAAKGWDFRDPAPISVGHRWVDGTEIEGAYAWKAGTLGPGLDCSGLVIWSCNKTARATEYPGKPVYQEGADGQFWFNVDPVDESHLSAGDLVFFDYHPCLPKSPGTPDEPCDPTNRNWKPYRTIGSIDHVAIYAGDGDIIEAAASRFGVVRSSLAFRKLELTAVRLSHGGGIGEEAFVGYGRIKNATPGFSARTHSPVTLEVTDPDGYTIGPTTLLESDEELLREIPGHLYYTVNDEGDDTVTAPLLKNGSYTIKVTPKANTSPDDTFGLTVKAGGTELTLATDTPLKDIAQNGYGVSISGTDVTSFVPRDTTPPMIVPRVSGNVGTDGWYVSTVSVTWDVTDPESVIKSSSGCDSSRLLK
jgi:hypothetical protein